MLRGAFIRSYIYIYSQQETSNQGGGVCLRGNQWFSPPASVTSLPASVTFKMASKMFIVEMDKNFEFIKEILFRFLGFVDITIPIVIENQTLVLFWNETISGVKNFKDSFLSSSKFFEHSYRPVTLLRAGAQQH